VTLNRRDMLRLGAMGAAGVILSSAASSSVLPGVLTPTQGSSSPDPLAFRTVPGQVQAPQSAVPAVPGDIDPQLFAKAKAALDQHKIWPRDVIGVVDFSRPSSDPRFYVVDLMNGTAEAYRVAHGRGSDPDHSGYVERFSNDFGSYASSNGTYTTGDYYDGKYGLSMKVRGLDWSNYNAEPRALVIHNAWYAEDDMIPIHGKLGRSEGCFAMSRENQFKVMRRLAGGRMIYADKLS
jgi:L,D-transpeptidase catalytic domain